MSLAKRNRLERVAPDIESENDPRFTDSEVQAHVNNTIAQLAQQLGFPPTLDLVLKELGVATSKEKMAEIEKNIRDSAGPDGKGEILAAFDASQLQMKNKNLASNGGESSKNTNQATEKHISMINDLLATKIQLLELEETGHTVKDSKSLSKEVKRFAKRAGKHSKGCKCVTCWSRVVPEATNTTKVAATAAPAPVDPLTQGLMAACAKRGTIISLSYARKHLLLNQNKLVPAMGTALKELADREAALNKTGRMRVGGQRETELVKDAGKDTSRDETIEYLEKDDQDLLDLQKNIWRSRLGKEILDDKSLSLKEKQDELTLLMKDAAVRAQRAMMYKEHIAAVDNSSISRAEFEMMMDINENSIREAIDLAAAQDEASQRFAPPGHNLLARARDSDGEPGKQGKPKKKKSTKVLDKAAGNLRASPMSNKQLFDKCKELATRCQNLGSAEPFLLAIVTQIGDELREAAVEYPKTDEERYTCGMHIKATEAIINDFEVQVFGVVSTDKGKGKAVEVSNEVSADKTSDTPDTGNAAAPDKKKKKKKKKSKKGKKAANPAGEDAQDNAHEPEHEHGDEACPCGEKHEHVTMDQLRQEAMAAIREVGSEHMERFVNSILEAKRKADAEGTGTGTVKGKGKGKNKE